MHNADRQNSARSQSTGIAEHGAILNEPIGELGATIRRNMITGLGEELFRQLYGAFERAAGERIEVALLALCGREQEKLHRGFALIWISETMLEQFTLGQLLQLIRSCRTHDEGEQTWKEGTLARDHFFSGEMDR